VAALLTTCLALDALGACGGEQPPPQPPPAPPPATASAAPAETAPAPAAPPAPPKPTLAEVIPQTLQGIVEGFNAHDAKKVTSYYTDDAISRDYGAPESQGREALAKGLQMVFDTFGDAKTQMTRAFIKGNVAFTELVWAGTMTGEMMGMKATKKPVGQTRFHIMWFTDDGLIKEEHEYADQSGLMAQIQGKKGAPAVPTVPSNPGDVHVAKGGPDEDKLADWGKSLDELFSKDDPKVVIASNADDSDYWMNFGPGTVTKGKKDMAKDLTAWFKAFPDQKWTTVNAWGIDGYVIVEHTMTGTQKGPIGTVPASNKTVSTWHFVDILQPTADGKLQHGWGYANLAEAMLQTGAMKIPAPGQAKEPAKTAPAAAAPAKETTKTTPGAMPAKPADKPTDATKPAK
jgi:ketosteroid isomerase-like protein